MEFLTQIIRFSLAHKAIVLLFTFLLICFGLYSTYKLKVDAVPDITNVQVQVVTTSPSLSALEIELYISLPVERAITGIPNLVEVRSVSRYGFSLVTAVFTEGSDLFKCRQLVSEKLNEAQEGIPASFGKPTLAPITTGLGEVYQFTLESENHSHLELTTYLNWNINPILKTVPGIVEVNSFGGFNKQYQILVNPQKATSVGVSLSDIIKAIESNNRSTGSGYLEKSEEQWIVGSNGLLQTPKDFSQIRVGTASDGLPIFLNTMATIEEGYRLRKGAATSNGKSEVVGAVTLMLLGENSLQVTKAVQEKVIEIQKTLPMGMQIKPYYDRSIMVKNTLRTILWNLLEGAILVILILFLMLGDFRSGIVIAMVIPLAMLFAILCMFLRDLPANLMSMGAIDFGLIVDGAVILVDNAHRHLREVKLRSKVEITQEEIDETILLSAIEVRKATIFGEIIIALVYLPILTLDGTEGKMFIPMATTVLFILFGSFILTLTTIPVLTSLFLKPSLSTEEETKIFRKIHDWYEPKLGEVLRNPKPIFWSSGLILAVTVLLIWNMGGEFLPKLDEGNMLVEVSRLPSTTLTESLQSSLRMEKALLETIPEIQNIVSRTGSPELAIEPMGVEKSDMYLGLKPRSEWTLSKEELESKIESILKSAAPEIAFGLSQPIEMRNNEIMAGIRADVGIKIFGEDLSILKELAEQVSDLIGKEAGVANLRIEQISGLEYLRIRPDRERLARFQISIDEFNQVVESLSSGVYAGIVYEGMKRFPIHVKTETKPDLNQIRSIPITTQKNNFVPLGELASVQLEEGPVQIYHQNQNRYALVQFNIRERDMVNTVQSVQNILNDKLRLPPGYHYSLGGEFQKFASAMKTLQIVVPITLFVIICLLYFAFSDLAMAGLIFLNIPFAITGGVFLLYLRGLHFSISAGIGFIALFGVAVLNGLVLVSFMLDLEKDGRSSADAVRKASLSRLRPVLTTALLASIGFVPMALSTSPGAEVQRPLATVVIGGLFTCSLLTLFVLPAVYLWFRKKKLT
ncbi:MAG: CusA/CzcA family heavy metal efflux RND transporter [Leptospira sp.]|nr:CusA/CzcA family heavy metal efflux RND transporter [Leptospira sp.]